MRHAKAVAPDEADSDEARVLAERGLREAALSGEALKARGFSPMIALVSPAVRTRETAAMALQDFNVPVRFEASLYHAAPALIWQAFAGAAEQSVIIVGHNPGLSELASMLVAQAGDGSKLAREIVSGFPTAAWAAFEIRGEAMRAAGPSLLNAWRPDK